MQFEITDPFFSKPPQEFRAALRWIWSVIKWGFRPPPITKIWMKAAFEMRDGEFIVTPNGLDFGGS
jgi:hypothetical protein